MITKNYKNLLAIMFSAGAGKGLLPVKTTSGNSRYIMPSFTSSGNFPYTAANNVSFSSYSSGVYLGGGSTPPTEDDYALESWITSGLSAANSTVTDAVDADGNPYRQILFTLTNTSNAEITIKEIGYVQGAYVVASVGGTGAVADRILLDRTVLSSPITIPPNGTAAIKYTLKTIIS